MKWKLVESSQISEIGYETETRKLGIRFQPGKRSAGSEYHYSNVSERLFNLFAAAESVESFFAANIKNDPVSYPYVKVEAENPPLSGTPVPSRTQTSTDTMTGSTPTIESPGSALALIDSMADDLLFTPGKVTDEQLEIMRLDWLAEAKKYDISTEKARTELKRFARPLQKLRTGIEARAKELTGATKRKIAAIDSEKRRLVQIVGGIETEVLAPMTAWEQEEETRKVQLADQVTVLANYGELLHTFITPTELEAAISELETFDLSTMQEYKVSAESAIAASLRVLKPELERRKVAEANEAELTRLRAEAAERAEQDRIAAIERAAKERAERDAAESVAAAERERLAAEQRAAAAEAKAKSDQIEAEQKATSAAEQAKRDQEQAVENERMRAAFESDRKDAAKKAREADKENRTLKQNAAIQALIEHTEASPDVALTVIEAIAKGMIPNVTITY